MKISKEEKVKVRRKLIMAAVKIIEKEGYKKATMLKIAKAAGVGDSTIYKYFPSKDRFFFAYYELIAGEVVSSLETIEDFAEYSLQEKAQYLVEAILDRFDENRKFVATGMDVMFNTPFSSINEIQPTKRLLSETLDGFIETAIDQGEIPELPLRDFLPSLFADYIQGIVLYWMKDSSENHTRTSQVIDRSSNLVVTIMQSGIIPKVMDLGMFFIRHHLVGWSSNFSNIIKSFEGLNSPLGRFHDVKR